jgi:hypothetical protein
MRVLLVAWILLAGAPQGAPPVRDAVASDWCRIEFRPADRAHALEFLAASGPARAKIAERIGLAIEGPVRVIAVRDQDEMRSETLRLAGHEPPDWAGGLAFGGQSIVLVRTDLPGEPFDRVDAIIAHELVHVAIGQAALRGGHGVPRWFEEGVAQWIAGRARPLDVPDLRPAAAFGRLLGLAQMDAAFSQGEGAAAGAYAQAESFVRFLAQPGGSDRIKAITGSLLGGLDLDVAIRAATGTGLEASWNAWQAALASDKSWLVGTATEILVAIGILAVVGLGAARAIRRRRTIEAKWEAEGAFTTEDHGEPRRQNTEEGT